MDVSNIRNRKGQRIDAAYHSADHEDVLVILGHGVTGNKDRPLLVGVAKALAKLGIPALRVSFAGNDKSEGSFENVTIHSESDDLIDIIDHVGNGRKIVYAGHSMGGAVGVLTTAVNPDRIQFLVSLAGMVDTKGFFEREFGNVLPGEGLLWDKPECPLSQAAWKDATETVGSTLEQAAKVNQPWLLIHGMEDDLVPASDSRHAAAAATCKRKLIEIPGDGHLFSPENYPLIAQAIFNWVLVDS